MEQHTDFGTKTPATQDMSLLIVGASGFVGASIYQYAIDNNYEAKATHNKNKHKKQVSLQLDLANPNFTSELSAITKTDPITSDQQKIAIICASISTIDLCAKEPKYTYKINVTHTIELINRLAELGYKVIFTSSDYVFDGHKGNYIESDEVNPLNDYGQQKAEVEYYLNQNIPDSLIVRLSKVCGDFPHPKNLFSQWMTNIDEGRPIYCISGQVFSPTSSRDIARGIFHLLRQNACGIVHLAGTTYSRLQLAQFFVDLLPVSSVEIIEKDLKEFHFMSPRPLNTSLCSHQLTHTGFKFSHMESTIKNFIKSTAVAI